jgi:hypothetical protein
MWALTNKTRFVAERTFARDRDGAEVFIVAVKATFIIGDDGTTRVAGEQEPIAHAPVHYGEPGRSSLRYETDLTLTKKSTDVLVHGHAYALGGEPAIGVEASIRIGAFAKRVVVIGDRTWEDAFSGLRLTDPIPFERMPLTWERAYGGIDAAADPPLVHEQNPVGRGFAISARSLVGRPAPNLEDPDDLITSWQKQPRPMGFGPIAREWSLRRELAGRFDERWERERRPLVPADFDDRFYQAAPLDQQLPALVGGEPVELRHLTRSGLLRFELPRVRLGFRTKLDGKTVRHAATLHTVILEPDQARVIMVWQTALPCHHTLYGLTRTIVREEAAP